MCLKHQFLSKYPIIFAKVAGCFDLMIRTQFARAIKLFRTTLNSLSVCQQCCHTNYADISCYLVSIHINRVIDHNPRTYLDAVGRAGKASQRVWVLGCDADHNRPRPAAVQFSDTYLLFGRKYS